MTYRYASPVHVLFASACLAVFGCSTREDTSFPQAAATNQQALASGTCTPSIDARVSAACPCGARWNNHGQYVSCVSSALQPLVLDGTLTDGERDLTQAAAAQSSCGTPACVTASACPPGQNVVSCGSWDGVALRATTTAPFSRCTCRPVPFTLPRSFTPFTGVAAGTVTLQFVDLDQPKTIECRYKADKGNYRFQSCNGPRHAGDAFRGQWFSLSVDGTSASVEVRLTLGEPDRVGGVLQTQDYAAADASIAGALLVVPRGATDGFQDFTVTVGQGPAAGALVPRANASPLAALGPVVAFDALGASGGFSFNPTTPCTRLEIPFSRELLGAYEAGVGVKPWAYQVLADGSLQPVASAVDFVPGADVLSFCTTHLSQYIAGIPTTDYRGASPARDATSDPYVVWLPVDGMTWHVGQPPPGSPHPEHGAPESTKAVPPECGDVGTLLTTGPVYRDMAGAARADALNTLFAELDAYYKPYNIVFTRQRPSGPHEAVMLVDFNYREEICMPKGILPWWTGLTEFHQSTILTAKSGRTVQHDALTIAHEVGHLLGLRHVVPSTDIMHPVSHLGSTWGNSEIVDETNDTGTGVFQNEPDLLMARLGPRPPPPVVPQEVCNGIDDNGDGAIDECSAGGGATCVAAGAKCGVGRFQCVAGTLQCVPDLPKPETCNGYDDDCDGLVDENVEWNGWNQSGCLDELLKNPSEEFFHGNSLGSYSINQTFGGPCTPGTDRIRFDVRKTGGNDGSACWAVDWEDPEDPANCRAIAHFGAPLNQGALYCAIDIWVRRPPATLYTRPAFVAPRCDAFLDSEFGQCTDGIDNDGDGVIDCSDPDCGLDEASVCPVVTFEMSNVDDDAYLWLGAVGNASNAICEAHFKDGGSASCDLRAKVQGLGIDMSAVPFVLKLGNGGAFNTQGEFFLTINGQRFTLPAQAPVLAHTGWTHRFKFTVDFFHSTFKLDSADSCINVTDCMD